MRKAVLTFVKKLLHTRCAFGESFEVFSFIRMIPPRPGEEFYGTYDTDETIQQKRSELYLDRASGCPVGTGWGRVKRASSANRSSPTRRGRG